MLSRLQHVSLAAVSNAANQALDALAALGGGAHQAPDAGDQPCSIPGDAEVGDRDPSQGAGGGQHGHQAPGQRLGDGVQTGAATPQTSAIRADIEHLAPHTAQAWTHQGDEM